MTRSYSRSQRCELAGSIWQRALLQGSSLRQAVLRESTFEDSRLYGSDLIEADLEGMQACSVRFEGCSLMNTRLSRGSFQGVVFETIRSGEPFHTVDLVEMKEFGLFPHNIDDHEELVRRIFELLTA